MIRTLRMLISNHGVKSFCWPVNVSPGSSKQQGVPLRVLYL